MASHDTTAGDTSSSNVGSLSHSAADKVFTTPELLEHILVDLHNGDNSAPQLHLFVIQRVNKMFQWSIEGSPELQRQMWLRYRERLPSDVHLLQPFTWLGNTGVISRLTYEHVVAPFVEAEEFALSETPSQPAVNTASDRRIHKRDELQHRRFASSIGSWRNIKLCLLKPQNEFKLNRHIRFLGGPDDFPEKDLLRCPVSIDVSMDFGPNALGDTLGAIFDAMQEFDSRPTHEHISAYRRYTRSTWKRVELAIRAHDPVRSEAHDSGLCVRRCPLCVEEQHFQGKCPSTCFLCHIAY